MIPLSIKRWILFRLPAITGLNKDRNTEYTAFQAAPDSRYDKFIKSQIKSPAKKLLLEWLRNDDQLSQDSFSILDIGCGPGALMHMLQEDPELKGRAKYTGLDQAKGTIQYGAKVYTEGEFVQRDVITDGLPDEQFDVIAINEVVEHISGYEELLEAVKSHNPKIIILCTFAALPERKKDRRLWRPDTKCYMNSYALEPLLNFFHRVIGGEIRMANFGSYQTGRYWFPTKAEILWYCRQGNPYHTPDT